MDDNNEYYVLFKGAKVDKLCANRIGVGIVFGIIGIVLTFFLPFKESKIINYFIIFFFVLIGYVVIGPKVFKRGKKKKDTESNMES